MKGKDEQGKEVPFTFNAIIPLPNRSKDFQMENGIIIGVGKIGEQNGIVIL